MKPLMITLAAILLPAGASCGRDAGANGRRTAVEQLPSPQKEGSVSVAEAIARRRSVRVFDDRGLTDQEISQLLYAAQGITDTSRGFRAAPSAGATYPLEIYLVTRDGIFRFRPDEHALETVKKGSHLGELGKAALGQSTVSAAPAVIVFTAVPARTTRRYGDRGRRYVHMEAGHAAQNVHLQAVALGLGSVPIGAFDGEAVAKIVGAGDKEEVLYLVPVGEPATER